VDLVSEGVEKLFYVVLGHKRCRWHAAKWR
jgi:hypothetical protein